MGRVIINGGGSGADLDAVTAVAGDILAGKVSYVAGQDDPVAGTMPNRGVIDPSIGGINESYPTIAVRKGSSSQIGITTVSKESLFAFLPPVGYYDGNSGYVGVTQSIAASTGGLSASKLLQGQSSFGISGTATSDANADAAKILSGHSGYVKGAKVNGSMTNHTGKPNAITNVRLANSRFEVAVEQGYHGCYWNGNSYEYMTYDQVANVIGLNASDLRSGKSVLGRAGTLVDYSYLAAAQVPF